MFSIKKTFSTLLLVSSVFVALKAQDLPERRFGGGIVAGFNAAQIEGDQASGYHKVGFQVGLRGKIFLTPRTHVTTDLMLSQRGSRTTEFETTIMRRVHLDYIEIPVMYHYMDWERQKDGKKFYAVGLSAGLSYSRLFNAAFNQGALFAFSNPSTDVFVKNDIGYTVGAKIATSPRWSYSLRYTRSLNLLTNDPLGQLVWQGYFLSFQSHFDF